MIRATARATLIICRPGMADGTRFQSLLAQLKQSVRPKYDGDETGFKEFERQIGQIEREHGKTVRSCSKQGLEIERLEMENAVYRREQASYSPIN